MKPLMLQGAAAYSQFRLDALSEKIAALIKGAGKIKIEAHFVYLLDTREALDSQSLARACT